MGFEMWMDCCGETARTGLSRKSVCCLFPVTEEESQADSWNLNYNSENSCHIEVGALGTDHEKLVHLFVKRPCGDMRLWEALFSILRMGSIVIYWPGSRPVVANGTNVNDLPKGMLEAMGEPLCVRDAGELLRALQET